MEFSVIRLSRLLEVYSILDVGSLGQRRPLERYGSGILRDIDM